jgi:hypothetical protein
MGTLKDSGTRRVFSSGATRDCAEGKGRMDLVPLLEVSELLNDPVYKHVHNYIRTGDTEQIKIAMNLFVIKHYKDWYTAIIEVSKQYEDGCIKYGDRNFEKGLPLNCFVDSALRHYTKVLRKDNDEPHDRAFLWNLLTLLYTHREHPEMHNLPFSEVKDDSRS